MLDPDDHVGVDVRLEQGGGDAGQAVEGPHGQVRPTSTIAPAIAAAAATAGLARWVRAPGPWRPTKLRLEVETHRAPRGTLSRSEEHTSELQALMRSMAAVFCLKKKKK